MKKRQVKKKSYKSENTIYIHYPLGKDRTQRGKNKTKNKLDYLPIRLAKIQAVRKQALSYIVGGNVKIV